MRQCVSSQRNFIEMLKYINCYGHLWQPFARIQRAVNLIRERRKRNRERETPHPRGAGGHGRAAPFLWVPPHSYTKSGQMITHWSPYILLKRLCDAPKTL